jgi:predicted MFS family arabinose efflux permease
LIPVLAAGFGWVALSQVLVGMAAALVGPCVTALTLGLVGYRALERRTGRNEVFNHAGNVFAAVSSGCIGYLLGLQAIFVFVFGLSAAAVASVYLIRKPEVDHALARGARTGTSLRVSMDKKGLLRNPAMRLFLVCCLLFHLGNAAMLPLAGQYLVVKSKVDGAIYMSACILIAQAVMVPVAAWAGQKALGGRKRLMLLCFVLLPVRGILYTLGSDPYYITAIQALDGAAAAIFGVASVLIVADLSQGTGHFNFAAGLLLTAVGVGASFSDLVAGWLAAVFSFRAAFLFLTAVAALAALLYAVGMKETYRSPGLNPA